MITQHTFPNPGTLWNPRPADRTGYIEPVRGSLVVPPRTPMVTVVGTVRNEQHAFRRCWSIWSKQAIPNLTPVEYLVLDDGSSDGLEQDIAWLVSEGAPIRYVRFREPEDTRERSCTLLFNTALRHLVRSPLVLFQWWDRIPGSFDHLARLVLPHRQQAGIATSATSRHIGGSSSVEGMPPEALTALLAMVPWRERPETLERIAGPIGGHCIPGQATESSGLCIAADELRALGGWDERYGSSRHGYPNVDLFRRVLGAGLPVIFPGVNNYHLSHPAGRREGKDTSLLADVTLVRNGGPDGSWGGTPWLYEGARG